MHLLLLCLFCDILHTKKSRHQKSCINGVVSVVASEPSAVVVATKGRKKRKKKILAWRIYYVLLLPSTKAVVLYLAPHVRAYSVPECVLRKPEKAVDRQQQ